MLLQEQTQHGPDQGHQGHLPRIHWQARNIPLQAGHRVRNQHGWWSVSRQGWQGSPWTASV